MRLRTVVYRHDWSVVTRVVAIEVKLKINNTFRYKKAHNSIKIKLSTLILETQNRNLINLMITVSKLCQSRLFEAL